MTHFSNDFSSYITCLDQYGVVDVDVDGIMATNLRRKIEAFGVSLGVGPPPLQEWGVKELVLFKIVDLSDLSYYSRVRKIKIDALLWS